MSLRISVFAVALLFAAAGLSLAQTSGQPGTDQDYNANPAAPQAGVAPGTYPVQVAPQVVNNPAYQAGFQDGIADGQNDRQANVEYRPTHTERFDDAPGYNKSFGDKDLYKHIYRDGYLAGYQQGHNGQVVYAQPYPVTVYAQPGYPAYPSQYANNPASTRGFQDGLNDGLQDRQGGAGFRETTTRNFEHTPGYDSSFGDKNRYKQLYRDAYIAGYQQGYNGLVAQPIAAPVYVQPGYAVYGASPYANNPAYQRGLRDGLGDGVHDRQKHKDYRPTHTENYDDTPGYDKSFGDKDLYKRTYRDAYILGYQQGYNAR